MKRHTFYHGQTQYVDMNTTEINALVRLLNDPDQGICDQVISKICDYDAAIIPFLQTEYDALVDSQAKERLYDVLEEMKQEQLHNSLQNWLVETPEDLLAGCLLIARYGFPNFDQGIIVNTIDAIVNEVEDRLPVTGPKETIELMNDVILRKFGFEGNTVDYSHVDNSYINQVIKNRVGNPIMLSVIYILVAGRLEIPIYGINSPAHFLLAYGKWGSTLQDMIVEGITETTLFYMDPYHSGRVLDHSFFDQMLRNVDYDFRNKNDLIATNGDIIRRIMNNLIYGLHISGSKDIAEDLLKIVHAL